MFKHVAAAVFCCLTLASINAGTVVALDHESALWINAGVVVLGKPESHLEVFSIRRELRSMRRAEISSVTPGG
jgi:hypothetical protein